MKDKFLGGLIGLAIGDCLGAAVEFSPRGTFEPVLDMIGGGPFDLNIGQYTDDTSMALCLAQSLIDKGFDLEDQLIKYLRWYTQGYMSSTGKCFDIGITTVRSLQRYAKTGTYISPNVYSDAGNGSLMRLIPVPLYYSNNIEEAIQMSGESSKATHGSSEAVDSCKFFGYLISKIINNPKIKKDELLNSYNPEDSLWEGLSEKVHNIALGSYFNKTEKEIFSSGYVIHSLEAALWSFYNTDSFKDAVLMAVNLGDDSDTVGAICGQICGVYYGYNSIPQEWVNKLQDLNLMKELANKIYELRKIEI
jgi:ADP-ribosylglycohydrolase